MHPSRMLRCGIVLKPSTLLHFHQVLVLWCLELFGAIGNPIPFVYFQF